jgi:hypothetical protein
MTKRIRYTKTHNPNEIRSVRTFEGQQGARYIVKINTETRTYKVINVRSQLILRSTEKDGCKPPKNLYTVYEQVKRALRSVGVNFEHEFRGLEDK